MNLISHAGQRHEEWRTGVETRMCVSAITGSTQLCVFEQWVAPGKGAPTHSHPVEEVLTVVSGEAEIWIDEESALLVGAQSVIVAPGRKHGFRNIGSETLHMRAILASPIFDATFDERGLVRRWAPSDKTLADPNA